MRYEDAFRQSRKCPECIAATLEVTGDRTPPPDAEAVLICMIKVQRGHRRLDDLCTPDDCPKKKR